MSLGPDAADGPGRAVTRGFAATNGSGRRGEGNPAAGGPLAGLGDPPAYPTAACGPPVPRKPPPAPCGLPARPVSSARPAVGRPDDWATLGRPRRDSSFLPGG